jgi:hypothetical protein
MNLSKVDNIKDNLVNVESNHVLWYVFSLFDVIYMSDYKI